MTGSSQTQRAGDYDTCCRTGLGSVWYLFEVLRYRKRKRVATIHQWLVVFTPAAIVHESGQASDDMHVTELDRHFWQQRCDESGCVPLEAMSSGVC